MHDECSSCRKLLVVISVTGELLRDSSPWKATRVGKINTHEPGEEQGCHVSVPFSTWQKTMGVAVCCVSTFVRHTAHSLQEVKDYSVNFSRDHILPSVK